MRNSNLVSRGGRAFLVALALCFSASTSVLADTEFTRIAKTDAGKPRALQLAIVTYAPRGGGDQRVDLVSAVHIGDRAYYQALNERFSDYDALLYELVAPEGAIVERGAQARGGLSGGQMAMGRALDLEFQLSEVDYTASNFVHADLSPSEMVASMKERDESAYSLFWSVVYASIRQQQRDPLGTKEVAKVTQAITSDTDNRLKLLMAFEFADLGTFKDLLGNDADSTLIGARNQRAIDVMEREFATGKKSLGIFYGAAHMPDLENRLEALDFVPVATRWVDAWAL